MSFFAKNTKIEENKKMSLRLAAFEVPGALRTAAIELTLDDKDLIIKNLTSTQGPLLLAYDQITQAAFVSNPSLIDKDKEIIGTAKEVIGSAIVGDLLFGTLGALFGAMSALNQAKTPYFIINYKRHDSDEIAVLSFILNGSGHDINYFLEALQKKAGIYVEPKQVKSEKTSGRL